MRKLYNSSQLQRIQFYDGQKLTASNLQDAMDYEARLAALHVRALHSTWGVVSGFAVERTLNPMRVTVKKGMAYDVWGRLIILQETLSLPSPLTENIDRSDDGEDLHWFDLVIRYAETFELMAECVLARGELTSPPIERPAWRWVYAGGSADDSQPPLAQEVRLGIEIPIARFGISKAGEATQPIYDMRRNARTQTYPYIAGGEAGLTLEFEDGNSQELTCCWSKTIDTGAAGFTTTPLYFVNFVGDTLDLLLKQVRDKSAKYAVVPFFSISAEKPQSFQLDVIFSVNNPSTFLDLVRIIRQSSPELRVRWSGFKSAWGREFDIGFYERFGRVKSEISASRVSIVSQSLRYGYGRVTPLRRPRSNQP